MLSGFKTHMHTHKSGEAGSTLFVNEEVLLFSKLDSTNPQTHVIA